MSDLILPDKKKPGVSIAEPSDLVLPDHANKLESVFNRTSDIEPDHAAKVMDLSNKVNEPPEYVEKNLPQIEKAVAAPQSDFWNEFRQQYPNSARFIEDPKNMAVAKDDLDNLAIHERLIQEVYRGIQRGSLEVQLALLSKEQREQEKRGGGISANHEEAINAIEKRLEPMYAQEPQGFHPLYQGMAQAPNMAYSYINALKMGGLAGIASAGAGVLAGPGAPIAVPAAGMAGFTVGASYGMIDAASTMEGELAFRQYVKAGVNRQKASEIADVVGAINGGIEGTGDIILTRILGRPLIGLGKNVFTKVASKIPGASKIFGVINSNEKLFENMTLGAAIRKAGLIMLQAQATEVPTEYAQEIVTGLGESKGQTDTGNFEQAKDFGQVAKDATGVIAPVAQASLLFGLMGAGPSMINSSVAMKRSQSVKQFYLALGEAQDSSKLKARLPDAHKRLVAEITQGGPVENVYIPAEAIDAYCATKGIDPAVMSKELGIDTLYQEAILTGGDIKLPLADWSEKCTSIDKTSGIPLWKDMADDIKFSPEELTNRQRTEAIADMDKQVQAEVDKAGTEDPQIKKSQEKVYDYVYESLKVAGRPEAEAKANAELQARMAVVQASRRSTDINKIDPWALYQQAVRGIGSVQNDKIKFLKRVVELTADDKQVVQGVKNEVASGEAGFKYVTRGDVGEFLKAGYEPSTFPEYFKNKGYTKKETLDILNKVERGLMLTAKQEDIYNDLTTGYKEQFKSEVERARKVQEEIGKQTGPEGLPEAAIKEVVSGESGSGVEKFTDTDKAYRFIDEVEAHGGSAYITRVNVDGTADISYYFPDGTDIRKDALMQGSLDLSIDREAKSSMGGFYSKLERVLNEKMPNIATPDQVRGIIKSGGVKQAETAWVDIEGFLKDKEKVSKQEIVDFIKARNIDVQEVVKGGEFKELSKDETDNLIAQRDAVANVMVNRGLNRDTAPVELRQKLDSLNERIRQQVDHSSTKFSPYQLPGGANYRELLFKAVPDETDINGLTVDGVARALGYSGWHGTLTESQKEHINKVWEAQKDKGGREVPESAKRFPAQFTSSHWDEPNVLAHARINDRVTPDGKKILFIEEIQSDWARKAREEGLLENQPKTPTVREDENVFVVHFPDGSFTDIPKTEVKTAEEALAYATSGKPIRKYQGVKKGVPAHPFLKNWQEFTLKRILQKAISEGYDGIAWTTGEQQAQRYDLSKQVDKISVQRQLVDKGYIVNATQNNAARISKEVSTDEELGQLIGKQFIDKVKDLKLGEQKDFTGLDLKIGGEWAQNLYDKQIPNILKDLTKGETGSLVIKEGRADSDYGVRPVESSTSAEIYNVKTGKAADWFSSGKTYEENRALADEQLLHLNEKLSQPALLFTPEIRSKISQGQPLFQDIQDPRGAFNQQSKRIILSAKADASTFLHESAHAWLNNIREYVGTVETFPNKTQNEIAAIEDWQTLSAWLKITPDQKDLTVEQHEQFARGFEAYVMEGNAPSHALKKAFNYFRKWLTNIYRDFARLNVELSNDVRSVMSRMVAAEDEITFAEKEMKREDPGVITGVTPEILADLSNLQKQAHDEAVSILLKKQMEEISAENKEYIEGERVKAEKEADDFIKTQPEYQLMDLIKTNYGHEAKLVAKQYQEGSLKGKDAINFEACAEINGYSSGGEMAQTILNMQSRGEFVAEVVKNKMAQFKDLKDTEKIKEEALKAIHNDQQLELMALEKQVFESLIQKKRVQIAVKASARAYAQVQAREARLMAESILGHKPIGEATSYLIYFTAEKNAAIRCAKALVNKDYLAAAEAKRQQMLNSALASEALRNERRVDRWVNYLDKTRTKERALFKQEDHFNQVAAVLDRFGFKRHDYDPVMRMETLQDWVKRLDEVTSVVSIAGWVQDESKIKNYKELTPHELRDIVNAVKNIQQVANLENRAIKIANGADMEVIVNDLEAAALANVSPKDKAKFTMEPSKWQETAKLWNKYNLNLTKMSTLMSKLDGYKDFGKWQEIFWESIYQASNDESRMMQEANKGLESLWSIYTKQERKQMAEVKVFYPALGTSATKMRLIVMALNLGNGDNRQKLFENKPVGINESKEWDEDIVMDLLSKHLTEKDWRFVQNAWDFINQYWPAIAKMHKELTGFTPGKVEAMPFKVTQLDGKEIDMAGGYFPLRQDTRASFTASIREQLDSPLYSELNPGWKAMTKDGHTKARTGAQYPISLEISLLNRHVRDVIHDLTFRATIIDLRRLLNNKRLQSIMRENLGIEGYETVRQWVSSVASGNVNDRVATEEWERVVGALRRKASVAMLFLKPSVIIQNLANPFLFSGAVEGFGSKEALNGFFVRGMMDFIPKAAFNWKAAQEIRDAVYSKSAFMRDRRTTPDYSLMETHSKLFGKDPKIQEFSIGLMGGSDELTNIPMWLEAYNQELGKSQDEYKAVRYADSLIDRTTGSGRKADAPGIMRGGELAKCMAMFYSFMNTEYNRWSREKGMVKVEPKNLPRFLGFVASRLIIFNVASVLLSGQRPKDDDDAFKWWLGQMIRYPFMLLPGIRDIATVAIDETLGLKSYGYRPSPVVGVIESGFAVKREVQDFLFEGGDFTDMAQASTRLAAYAWPYPDQMNNWFWNAYYYLINGMSPELDDFYRRRPKNER